MEANFTDLSSLARGNKLAAASESQRAERDRMRMREGVRVSGEFEGAWRASAGGMARKAHFFGGRNCSKLAGCSYSCGRNGIGTEVVFHP